MRKKVSESRRKFIKNTSFAGAAVAIQNICTFHILGANADLNVQPDEIKKLSEIEISKPEKGINSQEDNILSSITIDTNYENGHLGNYRIIEPDIISVGPVSHHKDTWFSFRIKGVKNKRITIVFEWINSRPLPENFNGAVNNTGMVTYDGKGFEIIKNPRYELNDTFNNSGNYTETLVHTFRENEALVSYCAPWSNTRMAELSEKLKSDARVQVNNIGLSKFKKLPLTYFIITDRSVPDDQKKKFFLIAREDSYEAGGSWAVEGLIRYILSDDPVAREILKKMVFVIFPIFSVDGVAIGSTNFPLDPENSEFVYVTAYWNRDPAYYEVQLMKDFWNKLKSEGFDPEICFKFHSTCYWECHFRPEDSAEHNLAKRNELFRILRSKLSWRIEASPHRNPKPYLGYNFLQVFPESITYSSHNDFIFTGRYLGTKKPVYRRHEDVMQDGELIARSFAEFYGIPAAEVAPFLMAGNVDRNCGNKGDFITYSVYYYDVSQLPPEKVEVIINNKSYRMGISGNADFSKPVLFTYTLILKKPVNDYYFKASNGRKERKIPEEDYFLPGTFILK